MAERKMIYLDDAIDAVAEGLKRTFVEYRDVAEKMLNKVPSAEPKLSPEVQDILDYLDTVLHPIVSPERWDVYADLHDMVSMLPSAQPVARDINVLTNDCISRGNEMNKQRKVLITITYNEMGIIIDTKAEEFAQPNLHTACTQLAQPEEIALHESCTDCPLYDKDRHSCPRFNKVIPEVLREVMTERRQDGEI